MITIDTDLIKEHFTDGQIKGFMRDLQLTYTQSVLYLWLFNNVSITANERNKNCGREMYLKFAKGISEILKESTDEAVV